MPRGYARRAHLVASFERFPRLRLAVCRRDTAMKPTRREFMITTTTAMCAISLSGGEAILSSPRPEVRPAPTLFEGDPYTAHVDDHGLGGRTWDSAYEHALRFRSTAVERDRFVLGWEV